MGLPVIPRRVFHVRIERKQGGSVYAFDLGREDVAARVADPYSRRAPIDLGGAQISPDERKQITILSTDAMIAILQEAIRASVSPTVQYPRGSRGIWARLEDSGLAVDVTTNLLWSSPAERERANRMGINTDTQPPVASNPRRVLVVHGRNEALRSGLFSFLRAIDLEPVEWAAAVHEVGTSPYVGEVLKHLFDTAQAIVVQMTPDGEVGVTPFPLTPSY